MLITPERKVPQRSDASQNDHKGKGYPAKTSVGNRCLYPTFASGFLLDFLKSGSTALVWTHFGYLKTSFCYPSMPRVDHWSIIDHFTQKVDI